MVPLGTKFGGTFVLVSFSITNLCSHQRHGCSKTKCLMHATFYTRYRSTNKITRATASIAIPKLARLQRFACVSSKTDISFSLGGNRLNSIEGPCYQLESTFTLATCI